jgi:hypothetical protein
MAQRLKPTQGQEPEQRRKPTINVHDCRLDDLVEDPAPSDEESDYNDSPVERSEDEDFEEGEQDRYLDRVFEGETAGAGRPRAHLAVVALGGDFGVAVQGIGQPLAEDIRGLIAEKAKLLKALGQAILAEYTNDLRRLLAGQAVDIVGRLVQTRLAERLARDNGQNPSTWRTRIAKAVHNEWIELPDGRVVPLGLFFRSTTGPAAQKEEEEGDLLRFLSEHPARNYTELARKYLEARGVRPGQSRVKEQYRKRFERLKKGLLRWVRQNPQKGDQELAQLFLARRGLPADDALIGRVVQILQALRGKQEWPGKGRKRKSRIRRTG